MNSIYFMSGMFVTFGSAVTPRSEALAARGWECRAELQQGAGQEWQKGHRRCGQGPLAGTVDILPIRSPQSEEEGDELSVRSR